MRISLIQSDILWEQKEANLLNYKKRFAELAGKTDLVVLPEMCTTGFSMQAESMAEFSDGKTITALQQMAKKYRLAICGSFIGKNPGLKEVEPKCFNRGFFIVPEGEVVFYDKRHLFRMGDEPDHYQAGNSKTTIRYMGWNIRLIICYDLRFPVWCRNVNNEYDLLLVVANWPEARQQVWKSLLTARAIENMSYVCGVNRVGIDGFGIKYIGDSQTINAFGTVLNSDASGLESVQTIDLDLESLHRFRQKFPVWKDADRFEIL